MSLARAFTKRIKRHNDDSPTPMARGNTVKYAPGTINRNNISLPTELISTTNVQALTAPDIRKPSGSSSSSSSSTHSGHDSDFSTIDRSFLTSDSSPPTPSTPPMDTDKPFFGDTPVVPRRAPSHSKKAHEELSRKLSVQRMSPPPMSLTRARSFRKSEAQRVDEDHPFGAELAQVIEVAEGFSARAVLDEEELFMQEQGLFKFGVEDYIHEIQQLYGGVFEDHLGPAANPWL